MTRPLFHAALADPLPAVGSRLRLDGDEGRHAAVVRLQPGEAVMVGDGVGRGVGCVVAGADKQGLDLEVTEHLAPARGGVRVVVAQALAKGDRSDHAIEMLTEVGVDEVVPWQASRSIVRWQGERGEKSLAKWRATVREAAKQSRRLRTPEVSALVTTRQLAARIADADLALVLHEDATQWLSEVGLSEVGLSEVELPTFSEGAQPLPSETFSERAQRDEERPHVLLVVGPEGGIAADELEAFVAAGARPVLVNDGVLRTSTAGAVAAAWLRLEEGR